MPDLKTTIHDHHEAIDAFVASARAVPATEWSEPRAPGKWSPGQVVEHVARAYELNLDVLHGVPPGMSLPSILRPLLRKFGFNAILRRGRFHSGSRAPRILRPSGSPAAAALLTQRLLSAANGFERDAAAGAQTVDHPFFGELPVVDLVRFQEIHTRHHLGQLPVADA